MASSLFGDKSTISDHVGRGKRWGVARRASLSFEMGLLCIYAGTTTETAAVSSPRPLNICPYYFPAYLNIYIHTYTSTHNEWLLINNS